MLVPLIFQRAPYLTAALLTLSQPCLFSSLGAGGGGFPQPQPHLGVRQGWVARGGVPERRRSGVAGTGTRCSSPPAVQLGSVLVLQGLGVTPASAAAVGWEMGSVAHLVPHAVQWHTAQRHVPCTDTSHAGHVTRHAPAHHTPATSHAMHWHIARRPRHTPCADTSHAGHVTRHAPAHRTPATSHAMRRYIACRPRHTPCTGTSHAGHVTRHAPAHRTPARHTPCADTSPAGHVTRHAPAHHTPATSHAMHRHIARRHITRHAPAHRTPATSHAMHRHIARRPRHTPCTGTSHAGHVTHRAPAHRTPACHTPCAGTPHTVQTPPTSDRVFHLSPRPPRRVLIYIKAPGKLNCLQSTVCASALFLLWENTTQPSRRGCAILSSSPRNARSKRRVPPHRSLPPAANAAPEPRARPGVTGTGDAGRAWLGDRGRGGFSPGSPPARSPAMGREQGACERGVRSGRQRGGSLPGPRGGGCWLGTRGELGSPGLGTHRWQRLVSPRLSRSDSEIPEGSPPSLPGPGCRHGPGSHTRPPKQTNKINPRHQTASRKSSAPRRALEKALFLLHWLVVAGKLPWPRAPAWSCRPRRGRLSLSRGAGVAAAGKGRMASHLFLNSSSSSLFSSYFFSLLWRRIGFNLIFFSPGGEASLPAALPAWPGGTQAVPRVMGDARLQLSPWTLPRWGLGRLFVFAKKQIKSRESRSWLLNCYRAACSGSCCGCLGPEPR